MKYKLGNMYHNKLYQVIYLCDLRFAQEGEVGGLIEREDNLSQDGDCVLLRGSVCMDNACVSEDAVIISSLISGNAVVTGESLVFYSTISDYAWIYNARLRGCSVTGCAVVMNVELCDAQIGHYARVYSEDDICVSRDGDDVMTAYRTLDGYEVTYRGKTFTIDEFMTYAPGAEIKGKILRWLGERLKSDSEQIMTKCLMES